MTARASSSNFERSCNSKLFQNWWSCQYRRLRCSADLATRGAAPFVLMKFNQWRQRLNFTVPSCTFFKYGSMRLNDLSNAKQLLLGRVWGSGSYVIQQCTNYTLRRNMRYTSLHLAQFWTPCVMNRQNFATKILATSVSLGYLVLWGWQHKLFSILLNRFDACLPCGLWTQTASFVFTCVLHLPCPGQTFTSDHTNSYGKLDGENKNKAEACHQKPAGQCFHVDIEIDRQWNHRTIVMNPFLANVPMWEHGFKSWFSWVPRCAWLCELIFISEHMSLHLSVKKNYFWVSCGLRQGRGRTMAEITGFVMLKNRTWKSILICSCPKLNPFAKGRSVNLSCKRNCMSNVTFLAINWKTFLLMFPHGNIENMLWKCA